MLYNIILLLAPLESESNRRYMKCKETAHVESLIKPISQTSLEISSICIHFINKEGDN
jgi:hypothetical protein